jgi:hypothetical protein
MNRLEEGFNELFPSRDSLLLFLLQHYARTLQSFDVTFYGRAPILGVTLDKGCAAEFNTLLTNPETRRLTALLERIVFSDGTRCSIDDIETISCT